jgi:hypothetical protein
MLPSHHDAFYRGSPLRLHPPCIRRVKRPSPEPKNTLGYEEVRGALTGADRPICGLRPGLVAAGLQPHLAGDFNPLPASASAAQKLPRAQASDAMWDFPARLASKAIDELWERLWVAQQGPFQRSAFATIKELIRRLPSPPMASRSTGFDRHPGFFW